VESITETVLVCGISGQYQYPAWSGPPVRGDGYLTTYNGGATFNPYLDKVSRLRWADNLRDLKLSNVTRGDEGTYQCVYNMASWSLKLNVRGKRSFQMFKFIYRTFTCTYQCLMNVFVFLETHTLRNLVKATMGPYFIKHLRVKL